MTIEEFIMLYRQTGFCVEKVKEYHWLITGQVVYSFPTLRDVYPRREELLACGKKYKKPVLFKTTFQEKNTAEYIFRGSDYSLEKFDSKIRNQIRKGLKSCDIRRPSLKEMTNEGFRINRIVLSRHQREVAYLTDKEKWAHYVNVLLGDKDVHPVAAFQDGKMIAYMIVVKTENKYVIYHPFMDYNYSSSCPVNAMLFTLINEVIRREGFIEISYGLESYRSMPGLERFKQHMLFIPVPATRMVYLPFIYRILINSLTLLILKKISGMKPFRQLYEKFLFMHEGFCLCKKYLATFSDGTMVA